MEYKTESTAVDARSQGRCLCVFLNIRSPTFQRMCPTMLKWNLFHFPQSSGIWHMNPVLKRKNGRGSWSTADTEFAVTIINIQEDKQNSRRWVDSGERENRALPGNIHSTSVPWWQRWGLVSKSFIKVTWLDCIMQLVWRWSCLSTPALAGLPCNTTQVRSRLQVIPRSQPHGV
jgi:hypothetical protein